MPAATDTSATTNLSWNDPQVFLRIAAGKTATVVHHAIADFANLATSVVREEVWGSGTNSAQYGPRRPKLSSLTIPQ